MLERTVNHKKLYNGERRTYTAYTSDEAHEHGIKYKYWKHIPVDEKIECPFYVSTDDKYVIPIYQLSEFKQFYRLRSVYGSFVYPKNAKGLKETKLYVFDTRKPASDEPFDDFGGMRYKVRKKIVATMLANGLTPEEVLFHLAGNENRGLTRSITRFMKTEECIKMASDLVKKALNSKGITEEKVIEWMIEAYNIAKEDRRPNYMMDVVNNVQDLLSMKEIKTKVERSVEIESTTEDLKKLEGVKDRAKLTEITTEY